MCNHNKIIQHTGKYSIRRVCLECLKTEIIHITDIFTCLNDAEEIVEIEKYSEFIKLFNDASARRYNAITGFHHKPERIEDFQEYVERIRGSSRDVLITGIQGYRPEELYVITSQGLRSI
mgnify:CR=1 FL=1